MRIPREEFEALDLEVHAFLRDVPLHDASAVDLPGGGPGRTIADLRQSLGLESLTGASSAVRALFALRAALGRAFRWDREPADRDAQSYLARLPDELRARSKALPGSRDGPFTVLYQLEHETLGEIRNATVHAFSCMALRQTASGYRFYWGIYVKPVSRFTGLYMAAIEPFRRFIVYPTILRRLRASWIAAGRSESP